MHQQVGGSKAEFNCKQERSLQIESVPNSVCFNVLSFFLSLFILLSDLCVCWLRTRAPKTVTVGAGKEGGEISAIFQVWGEKLTLCVCAQRKRRRLCNSSKRKRHLINCRSLARSCFKLLLLLLAARAQLLFLTVDAFLLLASKNFAPPK